MSTEKTAERCLWVFLLISSPAAAQAVTYNKDVAPLLNDRCAMCHHPDGSAPFSLLTYDDAKRHAAQIVKVTQDRLMPPWKVEPGFGPFIGQHPLSGSEIALLRRWSDAGAPEGPQSGIRNPESATRNRQSAMEWSGGWQLGKPDLVLTLPQPYTLAPEGTDAFHVFVLPIPTTTRRYVRGLEFLPGNARVVHHANIRIDRTPTSRRLDEADPGPGYDGLIARTADYPDGHFLGWTPGQAGPLLPKGLAWTLEPNTDLVVELHMQPSGKRESVAPTIGLYFTQDPPERIPAMLRLGRQDIDIPAGDAHYVVKDSYTLPVDVDVVALQPHAHYRARQIRGEATLPDGSTKTLLVIKDWDFRWQHVFRYEAPLALPKGTTLSMEYVYDNSSANPRNPERPPVRARWGQRSAEEMGDLWVQVLTKTGADLDLISRDFRKKVAAEDVKGYEGEIAKQPADAALHDDVALLYLELGKSDAAIAHFKTSLALKPRSAVAHYNLGTALTVARRLDDAAGEYREALRIDPAYANAHNNLGNVLLSQKKYDDAIREFAEVVRLQPASEAAKKNLAAARAMAERR
jgi:hypothetical protein